MKTDFVSGCFVAALALGMAVTTAAQQPAVPANQLPAGVIWSFDPPSRTVYPLPANAASSATYTGVVTMTLHAKLSSKVAAGSVLRCAGTANLVFAIEGGLGSISDSVTPPYASSESVDAVVSGETATCSFAIPYAWTVPASTKDATVTVTGINGNASIAEDALGATGAVVRTLRNTAAAAQTSAPPAQDNATTALIMNTTL